MSPVLTPQQHRELLIELRKAGLATNLLAFNDLPLVRRGPGYAGDASGPEFAKTVERAIKAAGLEGIVDLDLRGGTNPFSRFGAQNGNFWVRIVAI